MEIKTEYRRDLQHTWMILSGGGAPEEDAYAVRMLTENRIDGLLACRTVCLDGTLRFYYDISSGHSLGTVLETEPVGRQFLERLLVALAEVMERLSEYLLDPDGLLLDPLYIYCSPEQAKTRFCWYPGKDIRFREQAKRLGSALLPQLEQEDRAGVVIGYRFYQYCEAEELTLEVLRGMLRQRSSEREPRPATREEIERSAILDSFFEEPEEEESSFGGLGRKMRAWFRRRRDKKNGYEDDRREGYEEEAAYDNAEKNTCGGLPVVREEQNAYDPVRGSGSMTSGKIPDIPLGRMELPVKMRKPPAVREAAEESETMLLTPAMLVREEERGWILEIHEGAGKEQDFPLTESRYIVGKKGPGVTLPLASSAVSRLHARLQKNEGIWYLQDMNSRNGTWCREHELQPEETVMLREGDLLRFADVTCRLTRRSDPQFKR